MAYELFADPGFLRELGKLPAAAQASVKGAWDGLRNSPLQHPKLVHLHGSRYPSSFRLRVGAYRVLGIVLASQSLVFLTTVFLKRRDGDYGLALERHEERLAAQGPPLDEFLRGARRRR
jgi:mRNA-degrading endonuclease RelE of RelBE toxin-antitoxin system